MEIDSERIPFRQFYITESDEFEIIIAIIFPEFQILTAQPGNKADQNPLIVFCKRIK